MEVNDNLTTIDHKQSVSKRPSFFKRFRRSFTSVFRRRNPRKRTKSEPNIAENQEPRPNSDLNQDRRASLVIASESKDPENRSDANESDQPDETNFRPPARVPVFISELTSELKQTLQLRSRKLQEGDKSPSDAITQIEKLRTFSSSVDDNKMTDVKIETETKTFEEKVALFEGQISQRNDSVSESMKRECKKHSESVDGGDIDCSPKECVKDMVSTGKNGSVEDIGVQVVEEHNPLKNTEQFGEEKKRNGSGNENIEQVDGKKVKKDSEDIRKAEEFVAENEEVKNDIGKIKISEEFYVEKKESKDAEKIANCENENRDVKKHFEEIENPGKDFKVFPLDPETNEEDCIAVVVVDAKNSDHNEQKSTIDGEIIDKVDELLNENLEQVTSVYSNKNKIPGDDTESKIVINTVVTDQERGPIIVIDEGTTLSETEQHVNMVSGENIVTEDDEMKLEEGQSVDPNQRNVAEIIAVESDMESVSMASVVPDNDEYSGTQCANINVVDDVQ